MSDEVSLGDTDEDEIFTVGGYPEDIDIPPWGISRAAAAIKSLKDAIHGLHDTLMTTNPEKIKAKRADIISMIEEIDRENMEFCLTDNEINKLDNIRKLITNTSTKDISS